MEKDKDLEMLGRIKKVDTPPFLFTRIEAKIQDFEAERFSPTWAVAWSLALALLISVNVFAFNNFTSVQNDGIEQVASGMGLSGSNQLYHE